MPCELKWPNWPPTAEQMLDDIIECVSNAPEEDFHPGDRLRVQQAAFGCKSPYLHGKDGRHVCEFGAEAVDRLRGIWERPVPEEPEQEPDAKKEHWVTIATELENFPSPPDE